MPTPLSQDEALNKSTLDWRVVSGPNLQRRAQPYAAWVDDRDAKNLWPYNRTHVTAPLPRCSILDNSRQSVKGINFASQDYLSLSNHPGIKDAARAALEEYGVHSAGAASVLGNTSLSRRLEEEIGKMLKAPHVLLYPTGWGAGYGAITGLIRKDDWVMLDRLAHSCLQSGARAATDKVVTYAHNSIDSLDKVLRDIRSRDKVNATLVVTEGLFSMDSDSPPLEAMQTMCTKAGAMLMVDIAHDFGALGDGTDVIGLQGMLGKIDLVMGSFSKTFASNGGFVASRDPAIRTYLQTFSAPHTFSNALSPIQSAVVLKAIEIINSREGAQRRAKLMSNVLTLRKALESHGLRVLGEPSAIVPVHGGSEKVIRLASRYLGRLGVHANLAEFPAVPKGAARFRMQVMADHEEGDLIQAAKAIATAISMAKEALEESADQVDGRFYTNGFGDGSPNVTITAKAKL